MIHTLLTVIRKHFFIFSSNSKASASESLENLEEMFPQYNRNYAVWNRFKPSGTYYCIKYRLYFLVNSVMGWTCLIKNSYYMHKCILYVKYYMYFCSRTIVNTSSICRTQCTVNLLYTVHTSLWLEV